MSTALSFCGGYMSSIYTLVLPYNDPGPFVNSYHKRKDATVPDELRDRS